MVRGLMDRQSHDARHERAATEGQKTGYATSGPVCDLGINTNQDASDDPSQQAGRLTDLYAVLGMVLSGSAVLAGWQCRQDVELGLVQGDIGGGGVGGDLLCSFGADDRRGDRRAG